MSVHVHEESLEEQDWVAQGSCRWAEPEQLDWWFPESEHDPDLHRGQAVCADCRVSGPCLAYALRCQIKYGTWGGQSEWERQRAQRRAQRARRAQEHALQLAVGGQG